ncbi:glycosyltransferase family 2 protein [Stenotrophomonas maltophilia]|uniref:glycosyltransferase family 2 protein n=1 Tax=Stenotrophomonas maltophilia TaxID=40324 RepID=UPI0039F6CFB2
MKYDLSVVITFHREGILAHASLRSYMHARELAVRAGIATEMVLVLDSTDSETVNIIRAHPDLQGNEAILEVSLGDAALARNAGISHAHGTFVCTLDGDDLISRDYLVRHVEFARASNERVILHSEIVVSFGANNIFSWQVDQGVMPFSKDMLLSVNPWVSAVFARREVFAEIPYVACFPRQTGFGYEDWHWSCATVAAGLEHRVVPETAYFYRLKEFGSVNSVSNSIGVVMPPSDLFGFGGLR